MNGMFAFDVTLTSDYPNSPPKVHFLTTGGGTVRFNP
jgi:ubiquitin-protein ligase